MMDVYVPKQVADAIVRDANARNKRRLAMRAEDAMGNSVSLLAFTPAGFTVADDAARLRGEVRVYQGNKHLLDCLIVAAVAEPGQTVYEYKRCTTVRSGQPLDYVSDRAQPTALIEHRRG